MSSTLSPQDLENLSRKFCLAIHDFWDSNLNSTLLIPPPPPWDLENFQKKIFMPIHDLTLGFEFGFYPPPSALRKFFTYSLVIIYFKDFSQFDEKKEIPIQKASGHKKPRPKAQWLDQKASGMKWVQILTKSIAPKEFSTLPLISLGSIEGRTHPFSS